MALTRATVFRWHSWLGLITGLFMLAIAWSGSVAVFNDEIGWVLTPELRADPAQLVTPLDHVVAEMKGRFPGRSFDVHLQPGPKWAHTAYVQEPGRTIYVHIDPATARVTRAEAMQGYTWNVVYFIRQLHVRLLMGFWGRVFVGLFGVTLVASIVTSLWIYRDWGRSLFRVRRGHGSRIFQMDLHKMVGAWALVINVMFGVTGAVLGLENLYNRAMPRRAAVAPSAPAPGVQLPAGLGYGAAANALQALDPYFVPTVITYSPRNAVAVIRGDHPGALIAKDASLYRVDLPTGRVIERRDARRASWGTYLYNTLDPLHFGYFGDKWSTPVSYAIKALWCILGLTPGILSITGGYMWWLRRQRAAAAAAARATATRAPGDIAEAARAGTRWAIAGFLVFLASGYILQAVVWNRGWGISELLWQHWMIKPLCLIVVGFPLTIGAVAVSRQCLRRLATVPAPVTGIAASIPLGALYLIATALYN